MPTLADILAGIDSVVTPGKRRLADLMRNPLASAQQTLGLLDDRAKTFTNALNTSREGGELAQMNSVMAGLPQYRQASDYVTNALTNTAMNFAPIGATVWHGSPHKFDKFDSRKIGTGEGNQSYGHGLYAAESPKTVLSPQTNYMQNERIYKRNSGGLNPFQEYISDLMDQGLKKEEAFGRMTGEGRKVAQMTKLQPGEAPFDAFAREWENVNGMNTGNLYKVDLPDEHIAKMLDWDKPLSQQSPEVRQAVQRAAEIKARQTGNMHDLSNDYSIKDLHDILGPQRLVQAGIPGIRYLDGGSRGAGQGTSNYVVFPGNEGLLNILERNGKPIK